MPAVETKRKPLTDQGPVLQYIFQGCPLPRRGPRQMSFGGPLQASPMLARLRDLLCLPPPPSLTLTYDSCRPRSRHMLFVRSTKDNLRSISRD